MIEYVEVIVGLIREFHLFEDEWIGHGIDEEDEDEEIDDEDQ